MYDLSMMRNLKSTDGVRYIKAMIGSSYVHKDEVAMAEMNQVILGYPPDDEVPSPDYMFRAIAWSLAEAGALPEGIDLMDLADMTPSIDPIASLTERFAPFYIATGDYADAYTIAQLPSLSVFDVRGSFPCHSECPDNWQTHLQIVIHDTTPADTVRLILLAAQQEGVQL